MVVNRLYERAPHPLVVAAARNLPVAGGQAGAERLVADRAAGNADDPGAGGQLAIHRQIIQCRDELAVGEITRGPEDDDGAGFSQRTGEEVFAEGVHEVIEDRG